LHNDFDVFVELFVDRTLFPNRKNSEVTKLAYPKHLSRSHRVSVEEKSKFVSKEKKGKENKFERRNEGKKITNRENEQKKRTVQDTTKKKTEP